MKTNFFKKSMSFLVSFALIISGMTVSFTGVSNLNGTVEDTSAYLLKTVPNAEVGSIGGEWAVLGLARSGCKVEPQYFQNYYNKVVETVKASKGVLSNRKYTEYSRVVIALTAIGKDPTNVGGYNLLTPLGDYEKTIWQGINGPIFALIALDSGGYSIPVNKNATIQGTREMYIEKILSQQLSDGGFSLGGNMADPDITGMALQALSKYQSNEKVKRATDKAIACLSNMKTNSDIFENSESSNSESLSQAIVALGELGISIEDKRFVKNGDTLLDDLMKYSIKGNGFKHTLNSKESNGLSTEQAFYALVSAKRAANGERSLYSMSENSMEVNNPNNGITHNPNEGLSTKKSVVKKLAVLYPGKTFDDISSKENLKYKVAIETLASRGVVQGYENGTFSPEATLTRGEFATIIVKALGLELKGTSGFKDVPSSNWYAPYISTAYSYGIVTGKTASTFDPKGIVTHQEAALMVSRAAALCEIDTRMDKSEVRDVLAQFDDYLQVASWASEKVAFCYSSGILDQSDLKISPKTPISRGEIALMVYNLLSQAKLL